MIEPHVNVFVGNVSARVRDKLWEMTCQGSAGGSALMVYTTNSEQGFAWRVWGAPEYQPEDFEGLMLVRRGKGVAHSDVV
jgi:CRISPR-associated protein Cas2